MKLRVPFSLAAVVLTSLSTTTILTSVAAEATDSSSISINFKKNDQGADATNESGAIKGVDYWTNTTTGSGTKNGLIDSTGASTGSSLSFSSATTWGVDISGADKVLGGYLDDGGTGAHVDVSGLDYFIYDVYVMCSTDTANNKFKAVTVNGISYSANEGTTVKDSTTEWGETRHTEVIEGTNMLHVKDQIGGQLLISGGTRSDTSRGGIAGVQIVNTYKGSKLTAEYEGEWANWSDAVWHKGALSGQDWINSQAWTTADESVQGIYASLASTSVNGTTVDLGAESKSMDALYVTSGNISLSNGTVNLINASIVNVSEGAILTVNSGASLNANGKVFSKNGAGSLVIEGGYSFANGVSVGNGTLELNNLEGIGSGDISVASGATLKLKADGDLSNKVSGVGSLEIGANKSISLVGASSFSIQDFKFGNASHLTLGADRVLTLTKNFVLSDLSHGDNATLTVEGKVYGLNDFTIGAGMTMEVTSAGKLFAKSGGDGNDYTSAKVVTVKQGGTLKIDTLAWGGSLGGLADYNTTRVLSGGSLIVTGDTQSAGQGITVNGEGSSFLMDQEGKTLTMTAGEDRQSFNLASGSLNIGGSGNITFAQTHIKGSGNLTKVGSGTVAVNSTNTSYTGTTTVKEGTLTVGGSKALGTGAVVVEGGTLDAGNQVLGNSTLTVKGGTLSNLNISTSETLKANGIVIDLGATKSATLNNVTGNLVAATEGGSLLKEGESLTVTGGSALTLNDVTFTLDKNGELFGNTASLFNGTEGSLTLTGTLTFDISSWGTMEDGTTGTIDFAKLTENLTLNVDDLTNIIIKQGDTVLDINWGESGYSDAGLAYAKNQLATTGKITFTIPEPSTATLSLLALAGLVARRRRQA